MPRLYLYKLSVHTCLNQAGWLRYQVSYNKTHISSGSTIIILSNVTCCFHIVGHVSVNFRKKKNTERECFQENTKLKISSHTPLTMMGVIGSGRKL